MDRVHVVADDPVASALRQSLATTESTGEPLDFRALTSFEDVQLDLEQQWSQIPVAPQV